MPLVWVVSGAVPATAAVTPVANPAIADSCGLNVTLVLDASGSIQSSHAVEDVRRAADAFLDSLSNTGSSARVTQFGTVSAELAPPTVVDDAALAQGGALSNALSGYYNPIPPRPSGVSFYQYNGIGSISSATSFQQANNGNNQYTNWDQSLHQAGTGALPKLVVFVTDGDPTAYDFESTDPIKPPNVAFNTNRGQADQTTLDRAVVEANAVKSGGTRMLTVGVGSALSNPASRNRLIAVSGPQVVTDAGLGAVTSINQIDVALVTQFSNLANFLRGVVLQLCSPSLTIRKMAQSADSATYAPAPGWTMTATPSVPGGTFNWILPDTAPAVSKSLVTDINGFAQFQWEPNPATSDSQATVQETLLPNFTAGRPAATDFRCEFKDEDGKVRVQEGELVNFAFTLNPIREEIVTCTVWNSFNYQPAIAVAKVNAPTEVRGDLIPPASVTSSYVVTNPGNTPLSNVNVTDNTCAPVSPVPPTGVNAGDTDGDGKLDPGEAWQFTCARPVHTSFLRLRGAPQNFVNTATARGTDPRGTAVNAQATDDVNVFTPHIELTKLVNGQPTVTVPSGSQVTYTYAATNIGNTPLGTVTLADDTAPCQTPIRGPDGPGNNDVIMDIGETWTYSCTATATAAVTNTATVTGIPLNPLAANQPFPDPNPPVTATDRASVEVVAPGISLTKAAAPTVVLLDPATGAPQPVTYTFEATNTGTPALNRPGATTAGPAKDPGWLTDARCLAPATYVSGDTDNDNLLSPSETWTFTCTGQVNAPTTNTATITGQPANPDGTPLIGIPAVSDDAEAFVDVLRPGIAIDKTALVPVVVDPAAAVVAGPDLPRRPAQYSYDVTNTGDVPLALDPDPPADNKCGPLVFVAGDDDGDGLLGVDETWNYSCAVILERADGTPPPTGNESAGVTNIVTATGIPSVDGTLHPELPVTATDQSSVLVIQPSISMTKTASAPVVRAGGAVTYTFVVANTGDVGLDVIGPDDDQCSPLVFVGGDANGNGLLDGADTAAPEQWTYQCTRNVGLPTPPAVTNDNAVSVLGVDPLGNLYTADAMASVRVFDSAIHLEKTVSTGLVPVGRNVTYGFDVTNTGESPVVADDVLANITLADISVPSAPGCTSPTFVGGDTNGDNQLDRVPAETWHYECTAPINEPTHDLAVVEGTAGLGFDPAVPVHVFDLDFAFVQPFHPALQVTKTATPTELLGGGAVTYTYQVRNTGDVPLADVAARITDDTCANVTYVSGDDDGDGLLDTINSIFEDAADETWTFTCATTVNTTTTNTVTVTGTPTDPVGQPLCGPQTTVPDPCDVTSNAVATVTVTAPGSITIVKRTTAPSATSFPFNFVGAAFSLTDGTSRTFDQLAPGSYQVTEGSTSGYSLADLTCQDPSGGTVISGTTATIALAAGESVVCTFTNSPVPPSADLVLVKTVDRGIVAPGDPVTFTITVTNRGPDAAAGVVITDQLPAGLTLASVPPACSFDGTNVTCPVGGLAVGASVSVEVPVTVDNSGTVTNLASVEANTIDPDPGNNQTSVGVGAGALPPTGNDAGTIGELATAVILIGAGLVTITVRRRRAA
jgi:uncharacterized repeat protein (TIGR01451 family)